MTKWVFILTALLFLNCAESDLDYENDQDIYNEYNYYDNESEADKMAIDLKNDTTLTGRIITDDAEYPDGKYKPADLDGGGSPIPDTGTPIRANERADMAGFLGALLALGNVTPSGLADAPNPINTSDRGQYLDALTNWFFDGGLSIGETTHGSTSSYSLLKPGDILALMYPTGSSVAVSSRLRNGGISFNSFVGNGGTAYSADAEFDIDLAGLDFTSGLIEYSPPGGLEMTGITDASRAIISCDLLLRENGAVQITVPMVAFFAEGSTYLMLSVAQGFYGTITAQTFDSGILRIKYDPRYVQQP